MIETPFRNVGKNFVERQTIRARVAVTIVNHWIDTPRGMYPGATEINNSITMEIL